MVIKLNCDLGENAGSGSIDVESMMMPHIDQANIACGFHAGDPLVMQRTLSLARKHGVQVGAHPGYPDRANFGRRSMVCSSDEIVASMLYQIAALDGIAQSQGLKVEYVKPHGALYNDMMAKDSVRRAVFQAVSSYHRPLILMIQSTAAAPVHRQQAAEFGLSVWLEAFADRCYDDDGALLSRTHPKAIHNTETMLAQVEQLNQQGSITTVSGKLLPLAVDSLCVHGDNQQAVDGIQAIRRLLN